MPTKEAEQLSNSEEANTQLTWLKVGGNSELATPDRSTLAKLKVNNEIRALQISADRAKKLNKNLAIQTAMETATQEVIDTAQVLKEAANGAGDLFKNGTEADILKKISQAGETLRGEIEKKKSQRQNKPLPEPRTATDLEDIIELSGGNLNAILVWRGDGDIDFYLPENRRIYTESDDDPSEDTPPKWSMRDFDLPAADIQLITGTPKVLSINGTRYKLESIHPPASWATPTLPGSKGADLDGL